MLFRGGHTAVVIRVLSKRYCIVKFTQTFFKEIHVPLFFNLININMFLIVSNRIVSAINQQCGEDKPSVIHV